MLNFFKPGARPQLAEHRRPKAGCGRTPGLLKLFFFFRKSVCVCVPIYQSTYLHIYLSMFVRMHPREQNRLITVKAAFT